MGEQRKTPPYNEEQTTEWLAWLAYNMQQHDQTIFLIENLQPDWIVSNAKVFSYPDYLVMTRLLWGMLSSLILYGVFSFFGIPLGGFAEVTNNELIDGLILMQSQGYIIALFSILAERFTRMHRLDTYLRSHNSKIRRLIVGTVVWGTIGSISFALFFVFMIGPRADMHIALINGLGIALIFGLTRTLRVTHRWREGPIRTVENLSWSKQNGLENAIQGGYVGLTMGTMVGFVGGTLMVLFTDVDINLTKSLVVIPVVSFVFGLMFGLVGGLLGMAMGGVISNRHEFKTFPNHGIWLTLRSAVMTGLPVGLAVGGLFWFLSQNAQTGVTYIIIYSIIIGLWYGGLDVIEHGIIRLTIASRGHAPLNYTRFLDYAAEELNFLQKVGGGYVFIHRYLLEHFAEIAVEKGYVTPQGA